MVDSLWSVPDEPTRVLMEKFYAGLWDHKRPAGRLEALRQAQLWLLNEGVKQGNLLRGLDLPDAEPPGTIRRAPPFFWAAFVLSGDWR